MKRNYIYIIRYMLVASLAVWLCGGCDVHEFPVERPTVRIPYTLHLDFNTDLPLHKDMEITRAGADNRAIASQHDIRYIVNVYHTGQTRSDNRRIDTTFVFSKSDLSDLNYTAKVALYEGTYSVRVWADYVDNGSILDKYYKTSNFEEIILMDRWNHSGSNDYRDAFRGHTYVTVVDPYSTVKTKENNLENKATIQMIRPMGKYKFVSTDVELFISRALQAMRVRAGQLASNGGNGEQADSTLYTEDNVMEEGELPSVRGEQNDESIFDLEIDKDDPNSRAIFDKLLQSINLQGYKIVFKYYPYYMPCSFNMFTDRPASSWTGISFNSSMYSENEWEMTLGYDYIFVNGTETTLHIVVEVYDDLGELISATTPIQVPVVRSKLTVVRGKFLTSKATGGITINPGYDGDDFNIEIK